MQGDAAERRSLKQVVFLVYFCSWRCTLWEVMGTQCASVMTSGNLCLLGPFRHTLSVSFSPFLTAFSPLFCHFCLQPKIGPHLNSGIPWAHWANAEVLSGTLEVVWWDSFSHLLPGTPGAKAQSPVAATSVSSFLSSLASAGLASAGWDRKEGQRTNLLTSGGCFQLSGPALRTESTTSLSPDPRKPMFPQYNLLHRRIPHISLLYSNMPDNIARLHGDLCSFSVTKMPNTVKRKFQKNISKHLLCTF